MRWPEYVAHIWGENKCVQPFGGKKTKEQIDCYLQHLSADVRIILK